MSLLIRPAASADARQMAELLNEIIAKGGTTAMTEPVSTAALIDWMGRGGDRSAWHIAEMSEDGALMGFQCLEPFKEAPGDTADIATFARLGHTGLGIGSRLFEATKAAALALGYTWINANIRADNEGGLIYYQSRGFRDWDRRDGVRLADGSTVTKIYKRYDLRD